MSDAGAPKTAKIESPLSAVRLELVAVAVGAAAGVSAAVFRALIAFFHNIFFFGRLSADYDVLVHAAASPWGAGIILVPAVAAVVVVYLIKNFAPEAKGHGVPEVMDAIYHEKGFIRPIVAAIKSIASAISIGSGGSVGREGPIIQISAVFGSIGGQLFGVPAWQRITLIAAGAAGGLAATFNTPLGGILFAVELLMHEVSIRTMIPVALATATASYVSRLLLGAAPSFVIPAFATPYFTATQPLVLVAYAGLGVLMGLASLAFIRVLYAAEDVFEARLPNYYVRHVLGMLVVGVMIWATFAFTGHYYIEGVGNAAIQDILTGSIASVGFLLALFALKLLATSLTLGTGASGGIFSPSLFMGAAIAAAYGALLRRLFPGLAISPSAFAVAGMAGMIGGATGAMTTAIVMVFEMTRDYTVIVPMTLVVAISYGLRKKLCRDSLYTLKLTRRGHHVPDGLHATLYDARRALELSAGVPPELPAAALASEFEAVLRRDGSPEHYLVDDGGRLAGVLSRERALEVLGGGAAAATIGSLASRDYAVVPGDATLFDVVAALRLRPGAVALLARGGRAEAVGDVSGLVTKEDLADALIQTAEFFTG